MAGYLVESRRLLRQWPHTFPGINRDSAQAQGLGFWAVPSLTGYRDVVGQQRASIVGTTVKMAATSTLGPAFSAGTANEYATITYPNAPSVSTATITAWFYARTLVQFAPIIQAHGTRSQGLMVNRGPSSDSLTYMWEDNSSEFDGVGVTIPTATLCLGAVTVTPLTATVYLATPSGMNSWSNNQAHNAKVMTPWYVGNDFNIQTRAFDGFVGEWRVYPGRAMSAAEVFALYDPRTRWELYRQPITRTFFFLSSGVVPTLDMWGQPTNQPQQRRRTVRSYGANGKAAA